MGKRGHLDFSRLLDVGIAAVAIVGIATPLEEEDRCYIDVLCRHVVSYSLPRSADVDHPGY